MFCSVLSVFIFRTTNCLLQSKRDKYISLNNQISICVQQKQQQQQQQQHLLDDKHYIIMRLVLTKLM